MAKIVVYQGYEKQEWEEGKKGLVPGLHFYRDTPKLTFGGAIEARAWAGRDGGVIAYEIDEELLEDVNPEINVPGQSYPYAKPVKIKDFEEAKNVKPFFYVPTKDTLGTARDFQSLIAERTRNALSWRTKGIPLLTTLAKSFDQTITSKMGTELIKEFWKGDVAAQQENLKKFGTEEIKIGVPNTRQVEGMLLLKLDPISEWNSALFNHLGESLEEAIRSGVSPSQMGDIVRAKTPEILNTDTITIQHEGKRPVTMTTAHYTELLARTLPFTVRNAGYISRMQKFPDMYEGWKSICPDDERSCEECVARMEESEKEPYSFEDEYPPYHPFCRCRPLAVAISEPTPGGPGPEPEPPEPEPEEEEFTFLPDYAESKPYSLLSKNHIRLDPGNIRAIPEKERVNIHNDIREKLGDSFMRGRKDYTYWYFPDFKYTSPETSILGSETYKGGAWLEPTWGENAKLQDKAHVVAVLSQRYQWESQGELLPEAGKQMKNGYDWKAGLMSILGTGGDYDVQNKIYDEMNFATISTRVWEDGHDIGAWKKASEETEKQTVLSMDLWRRDNNQQGMYQSAVYERMQGETAEFLEKFKAKGYYTEVDKNSGERTTYIDKIMLGEATSLQMHRALSDEEWKAFATDPTGVLINFVNARDIVTVDVVKAIGAEDMLKVNRITNTIMTEWMNSIKASGASNFRYKEQGGDISDMFNRTIMLNYIDPKLSAENTPGFRLSLYSSMKEGAMSGPEAAPLRSMFSAPRDEDKGKLGSLPELIKGKPARTILNEFPNKLQTISEIFASGNSPDTWILDFKPRPGMPLFEFARLTGAYGDTNLEGNHIRIADNLINKPQGRHTAVHEYAHLTSYNLPMVEDRSVYKGYGGGYMRTFNPTYNPDLYAKVRLEAFEDEAQRNATFRERWEAVKDYKSVQPLMEDLAIFGPNAGMMKVSESRVQEIWEMRKNIDAFLLEPKIDTGAGSFSYGEITLYGYLPRDSAREAEQMSNGNAYKLIKGLKEGKPRNVSSALKEHPTFTLNDSFILANTSKEEAWKTVPFEGAIRVELSLKDAHAVPINDKGEWLIGRSHAFMFREAGIDKGPGLKDMPYAKVWVDPPDKKERGIVRRGEYIDHYGEKPNFDRLAQNFGTTPALAEQWFKEELANVGKMVRLSVVLDKETDGAIGAFDEVLDVTKRWEATLLSGRWPLVAGEGGSWNPDPVQNDALYNKVKKLPKEQIRAIVDALKDPVILNKSLEQIGRLGLNERQLKELDAIKPKLDEALSRVKTTNDMTMFTRFGYYEPNLEKGKVLPANFYLFGNTDINTLITDPERIMLERKSKAGPQPADKTASIRGGFVEIRVPKGTNALGIGKQTVILGKDTELEYVRSYDHISGVRVAIFQPKGAVTDFGGVQKTVPEQIEKELSDLASKNPMLTAVHQAKYCIAAKYSPGAGQVEVGVTNFKEYFSKHFPPNYDEAKKDDILNYYLQTWLERAGDNLYSASTDWKNSAEERWAMFVQGVYMDQSQVEKIAPDPYAAFMKKLDAEGYGKGLPKILGRPEKVGILSDEPGVGKANHEDVIKDLTKSWSVFKKEYTPDELEMIASYRSDFFNKINGMHRGTIDVTQEEFKKVSDTTRLLDSSMHEIGLQGNVKGYVVGYRGFTHEELVNKWDHLAGSVLENSGYTSISFDEKVAAKYAAKKPEGIIAEVRVDPGVKGLYMDAVVGKERGENELLLPRNLQSRIVKNWIDEGGQRRMILEVFRQ